MYKYKYHLNAKYGYNNEGLDFCPERVTYLNFDTWLTFRNADPDHWYCLHKDPECPYLLPMYDDIYFEKDKCKKPIYIKFISARDYRKYKRFKTKLLKKGEDYTNLKEIEALSKHLSGVAQERARKAQEEAQKALEEAKKHYYSAIEKPTPLTTK